MSSNIGLQQEQLQQRHTHVSTGTGSRILNSTSTRAGSSADAPTYRGGWSRLRAIFAICNNRSLGRMTSGKTYLYCCYQAEGSHPMWLRWLHSIRKSAIWRLFFFFFSLFLLFGPPVQYLTVNESGDFVFEIIRLVTLAFFVFDMLVCCIADKEYFACSLCGGSASSTSAIQSTGSNTPRRNSLAGMETKVAFVPFAIGSFLFWCDLISTLAILYDLCYVNENACGTRELQIELGSDGVPLPPVYIGSGRLNPTELEFNLLIVIARSARCARFVQHQAVVGACSKINWFWGLQNLRWLNPWFYCHQYHRQKFRYRVSARRGGDPVNFAADSIIEAAESTKNSPWNSLRAEAQSNIPTQAGNGSPPKRVHFCGEMRKILNRTFLQSTKRVRTEKTSAEKHFAAMKIQNEWRKHLRFENAKSMDLDVGAFNSMTEGSDRVDAANRSSGRYRSSKSSPRARVIGRHPSNGGRTHQQAMPPESRFQSQAGKGRESQVGSDMRELTGQRVAIGTLFALLCTVLFTYTQVNMTMPTTMVVLHKQTQYAAFQAQALRAAIDTSLPKLYKYQPVDGDIIELSEISDSALRDRDKLKITIRGPNGSSVGWFDFSSDTNRIAAVDLAATFFIIIFWFFGVTAFSGPVMVLVVTPIERMVRLLGMLMLDPLGYQSTPRFKRFILDEDDIIKNTRWTKEVLKGMETSFLMSTILRIGSLMKVGFGSAGVEIIRNNLQKGQNKNSLILNSQGSTVSCIFLFCDIRQFTDATESLQEEVFVFTNRIAAVVHSLCHSYGGAANKNVGDAFLLSWSLENQSNGLSNSNDGSGTLKAKSNQADKALLSVIKIRISLYFDKFYLDPLTEMAKGRLKAKLRNRLGPVVQMGFGLHAGKAVQGAIGSPRKIDATYVSEAVERAEFLEASTKKYELRMLMSGSFYALLHPSTRRRCRMIDRLFIVDEDEDADEDDDELHGEQMDIYTFDMDVEALHGPPGRSLKKIGEYETQSEGGSISGDHHRGVKVSKRGERRSYGSARQTRNRRRSTVSSSGTIASEEFVVIGGNFNQTSENGSVPHPSTGQASVSSIPSDDINPNLQGPPELVLPTGPALYSHNVWQSPDMKRIRDKYVQGLFFQKFNDGLMAYYSKDWETARICFQYVLDTYDDGPSKYFLTQMKLNGGVPPRGFREFGVA